jgi:hypothetical protein
MAFTNAQFYKIPEIENSLDIKSFLIVISIEFCFIIIQLELNKFIL